MSKISTALAAMTVSMMLVLVGAPASQAADTQPPELLSIQRTTPDQLDVNIEDAEVLVDASDDSGVLSVEVNIRMVGPDTTTRCLYGNSAHPGGQPGPWPVSLCGYSSLGSNPEPRTVIVDSVKLTDMAGNSVTITDRALLGPLEYRIVNPDYDNQAPTLVSLEVEPAVVLPGESVTVRTTVADAAPYAGATYTVGGSLTADGVCCNSTIAWANRDNGDGTFTNEMTYKTSTDTLYGSYPLTDLRLSDAHRNEIVVPTDAAIVVDDPAHPVGDLKLLGEFTVGQSITAATSGWDPSAKITYEWNRSGYTPSPGPSTYVTGVDVYKSWVNVHVTGTWPDGTVRVRRTTSPRIEQGTLELGLPKLGSVPRVGQKITAAYPVLDTATYTQWVEQEYQWLRDGVPIEGAETRSYTPVAADRGRKLSIRITSSAPGYADVSATSTQAVVAAGTLSAPVPTIAGTPRVGVSLRAVPGTWTTGTALKYQWQRNGVNIPLATSSKYVPTAAERGRSVRVRVTGTKAGYATTTKYSGTRTPAMGTLSASVPTIAGTPRVGVSLRAVPGTWSTGTALKYQWQRNGVNIPLATGRNYVAKGRDRSAVLRVRVSGAKPGYASMVKSSAGVRVR